MSENKEYITHEQEDGKIHISQEVICSITAMAVQEVDGVFGLNTNIGSELAGKLSKKNNSKGVRISVGENDELSIDCYVVALYGYAVMDVAKNVQDAVTSAVESTTGLTVKQVNVSISGISMPKEKK